MEGNRVIRKGRVLIGALAVLVVIVASAGAVFAATTPAPVVTGDAAALEARQALCLETRKAVLDEQVAEGTLTREEADALYARVQERIAACDGTGDGTGTMRRAGRNGAAGTQAGSGQGAMRGMRGTRGGNAGVCTVTPAA